jgi:hypothetical protein
MDVKTVSAAANANGARGVPLGRNPAARAPRPALDPGGGNLASKNLGRLVIPAKVE